MKSLICFVVLLSALVIADKNDPEVVKAREVLFDLMESCTHFQSEFHYADIALLGFRQERDKFKTAYLADNSKLYQLRQVSMKFARFHQLSAELNHRLKITPERINQELTPLLSPLAADLSTPLKPVSGNDRFFRDMAFTGQRIRLSASRTQRELIAAAKTIEKELLELRAILSEAHQRQLDEWIKYDGQGIENPLTELLKQ